MRWVLGVGLAVACLVGTARSEAKPALIVEQDSSLEGTHDYSHVVIKSGATLRVLRPSRGFAGVHIRATSIVIEAGATLDASGVGYAGADNEPGAGAGGGLAGMANQPGGGGGHVGVGGPGTSATDCSIIGADGGPAYSMLTEALAGSAGGAAGLAAPTVLNQGGDGGGVIVLEASRIEIAGSILAEGRPGLFKQPYGAGGGAGGGIHIKAFDLVVSEGARISVKGGDGGRKDVATMPMAPESGRGGGGSGGFVIVEAPPVDMAFFDVRGGMGCDGSGPGDGSPGMVEFRTPPSECFDLDGDGVPGCPGDDCDDVDDTIHPGAEETCDGIDQDCDGTAEADEAKLDGSPICDPGFACEPLEDATKSKCQPIANGTGGSAPTGPVEPLPDEVRYVGGCSVARAPAKIAAALAATVLAVLGLAMRRARCPSRR